MQQVNNQSGVLVSRTENSYDRLDSHDGIEFVYTADSTTTTWDIDAANTLVDTKRTVTTVDVYGNPTEIRVVTTGDGKTHTVITANTYNTPSIANTPSSIDDKSWQLDRLNEATITSIQGGLVTRRQSSFLYNEDGLLTREGIELGRHVSLWLRTTYQYDDFGNINYQLEQSGGDSRITTTEYTQGTFPSVITNALNHTEDRLYDLTLGVLLRQTGPNGLTTAWRYDSFGRRLLETRPDGTTTKWEYGDCDGSVLANCAHFVRTTESGSTPVTVYFDHLSRQIREQRTSFDGRQVFVDSYYNRLGQRRQATQPYFATGGQIHFTEFTYDELGRVIHEIRPGFVASNGTNNGYIKTKTDYRGRTQDIYIEINTASAEAEVVTGNPPSADPNNSVADRKMTKVYDARGNVIEMYDYDGGTAFKTQYRYDPQGNLIETIDADGNSLTITYDDRDRKVSMSDPDMGQWFYRYNGFGELLGQTDSEGNTVNMSYDKLGRLVERREPLRNGSSERSTTTWVYDTAEGAGIGKLHSVSRSEDNFSQTFTYDSLGRSQQSHTIIDEQGDGVGPEDNYFVTTAYDVFSRLERMVYPTGFSTRNHYNARGYLNRVTEATNDDLFWQLEATDQFGNVTRESFGNEVESIMNYDARTGYLQDIHTISNGNVGVVQDNLYMFDNLSNLVGRNDRRVGANETFTYDTLNRLRSANSSRYGTKTYTYNDIGNILTKSDFSLDQDAANGPAYTYGERNAGPHAVTSVRLRNGTTAQYNYDNNGRMINGNGRSIDWSSFNKPTRITRGSAEVNFIYGPDRARIVQQSTNSSTVYLTGTGAHYEKETKDGVTSKRHFIYGGNGMAAIYTLRSNLTDETRYTHKDHLGSIETVTNEAGAVVERRSFGPFGQSRTPDACTTAVCQTVQLIADSTTTNRGFTGHEHLEEVGLIHMNGRVYDPDLGRFLSADPNVQEPFNPQNLNRYSYVNNNPLSLTDPTGFIFKRIFRAVGNFFRSIARAVRSIVRAIRPFITTIAAIVVSVKVPFPAGAFLSGVISSGGDLKQGLIATITAGAFIGVGATFSGTLTTAQKIGKVLAHGAIGGLSSAASGGDFKSGFLSGAVAAGASEFGGGLFADGKETIGTLERTRDLTSTELIRNASIAAVAGGVASVAGGGKFQNGALTGAFSRLYNTDGIARKRSRLIEDVFNRENVSGKVRQEEIFGEPFDAELEASPWETIQVSDGVDLGDLVPQNAARKRVVSIARALTITVTQARTVTTGQVQRFKVFEFDAVFDLVDGNKVNIDRKFGTKTFVETITKPTGRNLRTFSETRTCFAVIGC